MSWRAAVFFVALTALLGSAFQPIAIVLTGRWMGLALVPAAVIAAVLIAVTRLPSRLPPGAAWYVVLLVLALPLLVVPWFPLQNVVVVLAGVLMLLAIVMVLLRLAPHAGSVYERSPVPSVLVFLAFTALLYQWLPIVESLRALGLRLPELDRFPAPMVNLAVAAIVVAIFVVASGIRHRFLQPSPARVWLWMGLVLWIAAAALSHVRAYLVYAFYALAAAQLLLFVGAFYLLSHLLPRRSADEAAFNP